MKVFPVKNVFILPTFSYGKISLSFSAVDRRIQVSDQDLQQLTSATATEQVRFLSNLCRFRICINNLIVTYIDFICDI